MVDWDEILKTHVVELIRNYCYKWWEMDIKFYDKHSYYISDNVHCYNPFCKLRNSCNKGAKSCRQFIVALLEEIGKEGEYLSAKCNSGLNVIIIPIVLDGELIGTVVGSGFKLTKIENGENGKYNIDKLSIPVFEDNIIELAHNSLTNYNETTDEQIMDAIIERAYNSLTNYNVATDEQIIDLLKLVASDVRVNYKKQKDSERFVKERRELQGKFIHEKYKNIVSVSPEMSEIFETVDVIENSEKTILIGGETGTGKELLAAAIHYNSPRKDKVFIIQNCSAFNASLLNSELFGHVKGSFTGAISDKKGLFQIADGGTLFLDEIGDMSLGNQANLLRVLENGTYYKVGGIEVQSTDVRIIAATNKNLNEQIEKGLFRQDLFYRINTIPITIPPLRKRSGDIVPLLYHFLEAFSMNHNVPTKEVSAEVVDWFETYEWPGNVRELKNQIERLCILSGSNNRIELELLSSQLNGK
ncbi:MAG: AAA domain-containing protein, partial [Planctomycetes bacterium]|nr:AAA domain-containing protein [Planctomycetota bacterium]